MGNTCTRLDLSIEMTEEFLEEEEGGEEHDEGEGRAG